MNKIQTIISRFKKYAEIAQTKGETKKAQFFSSTVIELEEIQQDHENAIIKALDINRLAKNPAFVELVESFKLTNNGNI